MRRGSYGYLDANGVYRKVHYIADKNGFRVMEMKSNEPGLDPAARAADVKSRDPDTSHTSPAGVLQTHKHPIKVMVYDRDLNNRLVKQSFTTSVQGTRVKEKPALSGNFIDNPSYTRGTESHSRHDTAPDPHLSGHHPSAIPYFPDLKPVPSSFPYRFEKYPPASSREHNHNLVQSSHSVPIYQAVKGRLQPDPYQKPLPVHAYRPAESNATLYDRNLAKNNYYFPLYNPPPISRYTEPSSTYSPYFESNRLSNQHDSSPNEIATQRTVTTTTPGYLHPLQPVRPYPPIRQPEYEQTTQSPFHYFGPKDGNSVHASSLPYGKSSYEPQNPGSQLPYPPYMSSYVPPRATMRPYVSYSSPAVRQSESPHSSSSRDRPLQYLDGPGPGAIVGSNRMEPSVFYSDEAYDSEKLANEVFSYAPHRTGPESPPPDSSEPGAPPYGPYGPGPGYESEPPPLIPGSDAMRAPEESTRQRLASYYNSVRQNAAAAAAEKGNEVPSVLLGIQSAVGLETGVRLQASGSSDTSEPDHNYTPSHYPSHQQILLLRKGLKNLLPLLSGAG